MDSLTAANLAAQPRPGRPSEDAYYRAHEPRRVRFHLPLIIVALAGAVLTAIDLARV